MDAAFPFPPAAILSDALPPSEAVTATAGATALASRDSHRHPRLTSATNETLGASGEVTVAFTRLFVTMPVLTCLLIESANNQPVIFKIKSWVQDGSLNYTGCVVKGYRSQTVPQNLVTLLLGGVFDLFNGSAVGAQFACIALLASA